MKQIELEKIIEAHGKWLKGEKGGVRANLSNANLRNADMCRADMRGANMCGADMRGANMRGADMRGANMSEANMREANMSEADMRGADMRGADMREADMRGAALLERIVQVGPIGSRNDYTIYWVDCDIVQCGCWNNFKGGSLDEFKKRIDEVYPGGKYRDEYMAAIAMFEALKKSRS